MKKERNAVVYCLQRSHISRYNDLSKVMASAGDIYQSAKDANEETLASLQTDFSRGLITSTEILYKLNSLEARIIDYVNSTVTHPLERQVIIPIYLGEPLDMVLEQEAGLLYLQSLLRTPDDPTEMKRILEKLTGKNSNNICTWTLPSKFRQESHSSTWIRQDVRLTSYHTLFDIGGNTGLVGGVSRPVRLSSITDNAQKKLECQIDSKNDVRN